MLTDYYPTEVSATVTKDGEQCETVQLNFL